MLMCPRCCKAKSSPTKVDAVMKNTGCIRIDHLGDSGAPAHGTDSVVGFSWSDTSLRSPVTAPPLAVPSSCHKMVKAALQFSTGLDDRQKETGRFRLNPCYRRFSDGHRPCRVPPRQEVTSPCAHRFLELPMRRRGSLSHFLPVYRRIQERYG